MKSFLKKLVVTVLTWEARLVLRRYKPKIVAVTGSVGKTSTKDAIYAVLAGHFNVRKSEKSFNSELGIPLTILGLPNGWNNPFLWLRNILRGLLLSCVPCSMFHVPFPAWLVLEVGADHPRDIDKIGKWLRPDAVVVTHIGTVPVHVEFFSSPEEVVREKGYLVKALKDGGFLFLNADDKAVNSMRELQRQSKVITFAMDEAANFEASNLEVLYEERGRHEVPCGMNFKVNYAGNSVPVMLSGTLGRQHVYPVLAALAFGETIGLNMVAMAEAMRAHSTPAGRMRIIEGVKGTTIIDDTYNSSPIAVEEALRTLREIKTEGRRIAVLGDMLELGRYSVREHLKAGQLAADSSDILVTVGLRARDIAKGALEYAMNENNIFQYDNSAEAGKEIEKLLRTGDIVLVKGSQGVRCEKIVEELMAHPEQKSFLLVRQEKEWQSR